MDAIATDARRFKSNDFSLNNVSFWSKVCARCDLGIEENAKYEIMQCPLYEEVRKEMFLDIKGLG